MSTTTTNLGLFKPELSDPADITKMNPNWDILDNLTPRDIHALAETATYYNSTSGMDLNVVTDSLLVIDKSLSKNCPINDGSTFLFILQFFMGTPSSTASRTQIAFPYGNNTAKGIAVRSCYNGTWGDWLQIYGGKTSIDAAQNLSVSTLLGGVNIPSNSDLNTYITVGNYYCASNSEVETIGNTPCANAFILKVFYANGNGYYIGQELSDYSTGVKYYRSYSISSSAWSNWQETYSSANPLYTYGTTDLTAGTSTLEEGKLYFVYE